MHTLYRMQSTLDGRGPYRPGLTKHWVDRESHRPVPTDVLTAFGLEWKSDIPKGWYCGCACRSLETLLQWFTAVELQRLSEMGYSVVEFNADKIVREDGMQVIFAKRLPLTDGVKVISLVDA